MLWKGLKRVRGLATDTYSALLAPIFANLPIFDELSLPGFSSHEISQMIIETLAGNIIYLCLFHFFIFFVHVIYINYTIICANVACTMSANK